jgi:hypothetical protein
VTANNPEGIRTMNIIDRWLYRRFYRYAWYRKWRGLPEPMSVSMQMITKAALEIAHQKINFIHSIDRDYEWPSFGGTIKIRKPVTYKKVSGG